MATVQKLALLVGCNYPHTPYELTGCINDVNAMRALLIGRLGFTPENITILTDDPPPESPDLLPTLHNIKNALQQMFDRANEGDILFFYFSGNGTLFTPSPREQNRNEGIPAIVSSDLRPLTAADFLRLLNRVPKGAIFTLVSDSSFSGGLFNEDNQINAHVPHPENNTYFRPKTLPSGVIQYSSDFQAQLLAHPPHAPSNCILIGSSKANQESVEVHENGDPSKAFGAYTKGIRILLNSPRNMVPNVVPPTNLDVATIPRALLGVLAFDQQPYLDCSDENAGAPFLGAPSAA